MSFDAKLALDTSRSVVVEACAGSGKTWLLSSRIARALIEGVPPRSILALTFTNKAAAEMRNRVVSYLREMASCNRKTLQEKLMAWGFAGESLEQAMQRAPQAFAALLTDPQPPTISTFHSWYLRLAAMAPLSMAGAATMSLSTQPWNLMHQAWQVFFSSRVRQVPYALLARTMSASSLRTAMEDWVRTRVEWQAFGTGLDHQAHGMTATQCEEALALAAAENDRAIDRFYDAQADRARRLAIAYAELKNRDGLRGCLASWRRSEFTQLVDVFLTRLKSKEQWTETHPRRFRLKGGDSRFIRKDDLKHWGAQADAVQQDVAALSSALMELLDQNDDRLARVRTQAIWQCGQALAECLDSVMSRTHEIDFSGLESVAWSLMGGEQAPAFHARLDARIRHILVDEFQDTNPAQWAMLRAWLEQYEQADALMATRAPKVFLVGDPKQSIYRFRRADPQVFQVASHWLAHHYGAQLLHANATRRCGPQVVEFLNRCMPTMTTPARYAPHETLAPQHVGAVGRLPITHDWQAEGTQIALALQTLRRQHPALKWSDMRILVRARTHMADYEQALSSAGVPFVSDRPGGLLKTPEVKDMIALLRCLAFPWSLADRRQVLKSAIFGLSDSDCEGEPASAALEVLRRWALWADELPVHDLLDRIIHQHGVFDRMASRYAGTRGLQCIANLEAFLGLALELDTGRLPSLARFIQELRRLSQVKDIDAPALGLMPAVDAVSLSTLHSAKGLEAEVVVLAGLLDRDKPTKGLRWLMDWNATRDQIHDVAAWQSGDPFTATVTRALLDDRRQSQDEDFNLLYVGITRARRFVLFSAAQGAQEADDRWYSQVARHCEPWLCGVPSEPGPSADSPGVQLAWRGIEFSPRDVEPPARPIVDTLAMRQGKALHRLLEFGPHLQDSAAARLMAPFALTASARQEVLRALETLAESPAVREIFSAQHLAYAESEWPVQAEGRTIFLRPDRVVRVSELPETWWIVDFKWQVLGSEENDYAAQLAAYQQAFQALRPQANVQAKILDAGGRIWALHQGRLAQLG